MTWPVHWPILTSAINQHLTDIGRIDVTGNLITGSGVIATSARVKSATVRESRVRIRNVRVDVVQK